MDNLTYEQYVDRLTELAESVLEWHNLPETIDPHYIQMGLFLPSKVGGYSLNNITQYKAR